MKYSAELITLAGMLICLGAVESVRQMGRLFALAGMLICLGAVGFVVFCL